MDLGRGKRQPSNEFSNGIKIVDIVCRSLGIKMETYLFY